MEHNTDNSKLQVSDVDLWQPLHAAACWGHLEAVEILAQNGADISAVTRSGETPFDITEDPEIKERLVELAEQRLKLSEPRVRRGRSSSTRTHSIRRTSLRDKMKTTKKDVAEEGLIYMKSVNKSAEEEGELHTSTDIVDPTDVQIILPPASFQKPVGLVSPLPQQAGMKPSPPIRPSRSGQEGRGRGEGEESHGLGPSLVTSTLSKPSPGSQQEPINIHVSVTINPGPGGGLVGGTGNPAAQPRYPSPPGTLADLKRTRSQSRVAGGSSNSSLSASSASVSSQEVTGDAVSMNPGRSQPVPQAGVLLGPANPGKAKPPSPSNTRHKFAASSIEVVGPPSKSGCCKVM